MSFSLEQVKQWSLFVERETNRFPELLEASIWETAYEPNELRQKLIQDLIQSESLEMLNRRLRVHRRTEMVRTAIRDLKGLAPVKEVMQDASELADGLVEGALQWHSKTMTARLGTPIGELSGEVQKMIVIGMGKLGGLELNFSSDIDLIFVYPEKGYTEGAARKLSNSEFFIRLGQALNKSLSEFSVDGPMFRVDMRLRPFGSSGPLACSFLEMEHYYELHGRAWERYALVKARVMAGDATKGEELFQILKPFVYRKYVDFTAMDSLRELKAMIHAEVKKKDKLQNVKLGPGGIREVEFVVQAFQLIHGGRDQTLQGRSLLPMLALMAEKQFLSVQQVEGLREAYLFLRKSENRLQEWNDQQTHDLPTEDVQQLALAQSMSFESYAGFIQKLDGYRNFVQSVFDSVFADAGIQTSDGEVLSLQEDLMAFEDEVDLSEWQGLEEGEKERFQIIINTFLADRAYQTASSEAISRFKVILPMMLDGLIGQGQGQKSLENTLKVLSSVMKRSVYVVLLKENPQAIHALLTVCGLSDWLTEMLVKYPALMDQLLDERALYSPLTATELKQESEAIRAACQNEEFPQGDDEGFMNQIRQWKHAQVFRVAAADVTGNLPVMSVSDYLSWVSEAVLASVSEYAWRFMKARSGLPATMTQEDVHPFMVLGYGKMGGVELGYGSDLDVVFLYQGLDSSAMSEGVNGKRSLENGVYFLRMGQKIISLMTTVMPTGTLYEIDTRLRPNGTSGMLVTTFESYKAYIQNKAWVWEHQALVRARVVMGSCETVAMFDEFKAAFIGRSREVEPLRSEVMDMRLKMRNSLDKSTEVLFDLKQASGGIVDIEFMVQFFVLGFAHSFSELTKWSDNIRLLEAIGRCKLLSQEEVSSLQSIYQKYRARYHRLALQNEKTLVPVLEFREEKEMIESIWSKVMKGEG